jgi:uncharacterized membrane protein YebE (DUF533 family)
MKRLTISARACTEILALLIEVAWADGKLEEREKASVRGAAQVFNLSKELRDRLDKSLESPLELDQILLESLSPRDKAFAYVAAVWLSGVDQDVDPKEQDLLVQIGDRLGLSADRKGELKALARDYLDQRAADLQSDEASWADQIVTLFKSIPVRLEGADEGVEVAFE